MDIFKISWEKACVIVGILGVITCPWYIMTDSTFNLFISIVSAFLGPIFAVMVADFYLVHKGNYNVSKLYDVKNLFPAYKGWNPAAIIAIAVGTCFSFINVDLSWLLGIVPAGVVYTAIMRLWIIKQDEYVKEGFEQSFTQSTDIEDLAV
ncbi:cytosine permease [Metabacillus sp. B2-18]|nr:cytosine permease [Metabacillus sp. B2-18]UGB32108.1 cytosine permease [Metabacillus sp. B2-18]